MSPLLINQNHISLALNAIYIIGIITLTNKTIKLLKWVYSTFIRTPKTLTKYGSWALITGCTDGIGKALTFELASKGLNLILVGRNISKLDSLHSEIVKKGYKDVEIRVVVIDFDELSGEAIEGNIREGIEGLDVGVLVNNVGVSNKARFFHEVGFEGIESLIRVNLGGLSWVSKGVIDGGMLKRKKGLIVNVGSGSSVAVPSYPLFAVYAATKAYVAMFSRSLSVEYKQFGIDIQCQIPLLVATKMASIKKSSFFVPSPEEYSKASIRWFGYDTLCVPYWPHALQWCIMDALPESVVNWILLRYFVSLRKKMIQKELRQRN